MHKYNHDNKTPQEAMGRGGWTNTHKKKKETYISTIYIKVYVYALLQGKS